MPRCQHRRVARYTAFAPDADAAPRARVLPPVVVATPVTQYAVKFHATLRANVTLRSPQMFRRAPRRCRRRHAIACLYCRRRFVAARNAAAFMLVREGHAKTRR